MDGHATSGDGKIPPTRIIATTTPALKVINNVPLLRLLEHTCSNDLGILYIFRVICMRIT